MYSPLFDRIRYLVTTFSLECAVPYAYACCTIHCDGVSAYIPTLHLSSDYFNDDVVFDVSLYYHYHSCLIVFFHCHPYLFYLLLSDS